MKEFISMIPQIKGKTSYASSLYFVFLLLLSGDIELNPGPASQSTLTITDLKEVLNDLRKGGFADESYYDLGLELGLHRRTLDSIKADNRNVKACLRECISKWLERADDVDDNGGANWTSLCNAVEKINNAAAEYIRGRDHTMPATPSQPIEQINHQDHTTASQMTSSNEGPRYRKKPSDATDNESEETEETDATPPPLVPEASSDKQLKGYEKKYVITLVCLVVLMFLAFVVDSIWLNGYMKELLLAIIAEIHHFK